jgi:REP element-mobilizing transposase RayT
LLTTVTHRRAPIFLDAQLASALAAICCDVGFWRQHRLLCWVLMPDHWHGVIELGSHEGLSQAMQRFKGVSAFEVNRLRRSGASVWAAGFHDHALRFEEDLIGVARYVVANPTRAGLATRQEEYPYWGAVWGRESLF